jgi:hypothetical protein
VLAWPGRVLWLAAVAHGVDLSVPENGLR